MDKWDKLEKLHDKLDQINRNWNEIKKDSNSDIADFLTQDEYKMYVHELILPLLENEK